MTALQPHQQHQRRRQRPPRLTTTAAVLAIGAAALLGRSTAAAAAAGSVSSSPLCSSATAAPAAATHMHRRRRQQQQGQQAAEAPHPPSAPAFAMGRRRRHREVGWRRLLLAGSDGGVRGGATVPPASSGDEEGQQRKVKLQVKTECGLKDLDQKLDCLVPATATVGDLKRYVQKHMAGHPPASLQRLFHMGRKLKDSEALGPLVEDTPLALPVILDMAPPIEQLDYEALQSLKVRYQSLEGKQPLFYAANAVGLKYALQALDEHLLRKPSSSSSADDGEAAAEEQEDPFGGSFSLDGDAQEEEEEEEEALRTRAMKDEVAALKDYLKKHEKEVPPPPPLEPDPNVIGAAVRELGIPGLESFVKAVALQLNIDWGRTARYAFAAYLFGKYGTVPAWRPFLLALVPGVFLLQLRAFRYGAKVAWESMAVSPLVGGFSSALLSAPQQVLLTFDEPEYLAKLYGPKEMPPAIGPPVREGAGEGEGEEEGDEEYDEEDDYEEEDEEDDDDE